MSLNEKRRKQQIYETFFEKFKRIPGYISELQGDHIEVEVDFYSDREKIIDYVVETGLNYSINQINTKKIYILL